MIYDICDDACKNVRGVEGGQRILSRSERVVEDFW